MSDSDPLEGHHVPTEEIDDDLEAVLRRFVRVFDDDLGRHLVELHRPYSADHEPDRFGLRIVHPDEGHGVTALGSNYTREAIEAYVRGLVDGRRDLMHAVEGCCGGDSE